MGHQQPRADFTLVLGGADYILQLRLFVSEAFHKELKYATESHLDSVKLHLYKVECVRDKNEGIFLDLFKFKKLYATISTFIKVTFNYKMDFYAYIMYQIKEK